MEGNKRSRAWLVYWLSLAVSFVFLAVPFTGEWWSAGACDLGIIGIAPLLWLLGLLEAVVAIGNGATRRWPAKMALWLGLIAGGVMLISFAALAQAAAVAYQHSCD